MRRIRRFAGAAVLGAVALVAARAAFDSGEGVPTVRATRIRFTRTIQAEGALRAVRATPITTLMDPEGPFTIAWLIADGSPVKAGEEVARFEPTKLERERRDGQDDRRTADQRTATATAAAETTSRNLEREASLAGEELETARSLAECGQRDLLALRDRQLGDRRDSRREATVARRGGQGRQAAAGPDRS